jgi:GntR family transcriptional regulator
MNFTCNAIGITLVSSSHQPDMFASPKKPPIPVYLQVAELLTRQIKAGHWHEGERLPTEAALSVSLSVAVGTLRKSLALLEHQNILERLQGSGTYVKKQEQKKRSYEMFRLELCTGPGLPTARILDVRKLKKPSAQVRLGNDASSHAWRVRRLRFINDTAIALEEIWFDAATCDALSAGDLDDSMYLFYQQRFGIWVARVEDQISVADAPAWAPSIWGVSAGTSAGFIERVSWATSNHVVEYSRTWFDPKVCRYSSRLSQ